MRNFDKFSKFGKLLLVIFKQKIELRARRELSNAYLLAKFGFDTAENEPFKVR